MIKYLSNTHPLSAL